MIILITLVVFITLFLLFNSIEEFPEITGMEDYLDEHADIERY